MIDTVSIQIHHPLLTFSTSHSVISLTLASVEVLFRCGESVVGGPKLVAVRHLNHRAGRQWRNGDLGEFHGIGEI